MRSSVFRFLVLGMCASAALAQKEKKATSPPVSQSSDPVATSLVEMERQ